jgi:hypothetical protein
MNIRFFMLTSPFDCDDKVGIINCVRAGATASFQEHSGGRHLSAA